MIEIFEPDDGKNWARKIIKRHEWGQKISSYPLRCAHEALGLPVPDPHARHCERSAATHPVDQPEAEYV